MARRHACSPGVTTRVCAGSPYGPPAGSIALIPPTPWEFPPGTVWACECGQAWISEGSPAAHTPGACTFRREGRLERWRRVRGSTMSEKTYEMSKWTARTLAIGTIVATLLIPVATMLLAEVIK